MWDEAMRRLTAWWRAESAWERERRERMRRLDALPLALADAAVAKLTGKEPIGDHAPATYTDAFVQRYDGWAFGALRIWVAPTTAQGRVVGELDHLLFVPAGQLEVPLPSGGRAPSLAHLALRELQVSARDLDAIERHVSSWVQDPSAEPFALDPPPPTPGPEAFALDVRPRAWALIGSAVTLPAATLVSSFALLMLVRNGLPALCGALIASVASGGIAFSSAARLREVVFLEPATRRLRPDLIGFFDPSSGKRIEWAEVRDVVHRWLTVDCALADGRTVRLAKSAFVRPDAFALAVAVAQQNGAARYR